VTTDTTHESLLHRKNTTISTQRSIACYNYISKNNKQSLLVMLLFEVRAHRVLARKGLAAVRLVAGN